MMIQGLVSTIIPVHNRPDLLVEAVASVLAQSYRPIEIIIVDDGSTDRTAEVISQLVAQHPNEIFSIHISNSGPGVARESGRLVAKGEFIQYLDSDDILFAKKFEKQVEGLDTHPECGVSYGKTRYHHIGEGTNGDALKRTGERIEEMFPAFLKSRWWSTHTPLFRRSVTDKAGAWLPLWNEEDWEYDCRIASMGVKLHFCDEFLSETRDHGGDRLCHDGSSDPKKLADRATAHFLIFQHAQIANINLDIPEMQHFARELFLLSRQCGAAGLADESRRLFELARTASLPEIRSGLQFRAYRIASLLLGWRRTGKLSVQFDKFRSNPASV